MRKMRLCSRKTTKLIFCILTTLVLSPLAFSSYKESRCAFVLLVMAIYWLVEPVHISVTALLPVPLMPLLGILDAGRAVSNYMNEVLMMYMGGLGIAVAVEHCNLHERIALKVLSTLGANTMWLMAGFMMTSMFLSMWISNSATTAMMVPIIEAVMAELKKKSEGDEIDEDNELKTLHKVLLLSVAYSADCGGTGTLTGTSPNMIFKGFVEKFFPHCHDITYASWMAYNVPGMILCVFLTWVVLQVIYIPCWRKQNKATTVKIKKVIGARYEGLGRMSFHEAAVLTLFVLLVFLWIFREPKFMKGWVDVLGADTKIGNAVPAIGILFLMFLVPAEPWRPHRSPPLLKWRVLQEKLPWGLVLLLGGGYSLADGVEDSGLSKWLGSQMTKLFYLPPSAVLAILCFTSTMLTEIMSNSTVTTILVPIVAEMALTSGINPLYLMLPVSVVTSYAFMFPVASGPNAIIFGTGHLKTIDMIKPGIVLNIIACSIQLFIAHTLGVYLFNFNGVPSWVNSSTLLNRTPAFNSGERTVSLQI